MSRKARSDWEWNAEHPEPSGAIPPAPSKQGTLVPDKVHVGRCLIALNSYLSRLRDQYLTIAQRERLADQIRSSFLQLQSVVTHTHDPETKDRVGGFLGALGRLCVEQYDQETGDPIRSFPLIAAMDGGEVGLWVMRFYAGMHALCGPDREGAQVCYSVPEPMLDEQQRIHDAVLLWLEETDLDF